MLTAISNKKLTKLVATRPSQEDSPIYPSLPPIPPFPLGHSCEGFILITHRPTIHRDPQANHLQGFFKFHLISFHFIFVSSLSSLGQTSTPMHLALPFGHPLTSGPQCNYSSTQRPGHRLQGNFTFSHYFPSNVNDEAAGFYLIINKGIWLPVLAERPRVFPIRYYFHQDTLQYYFKLALYMSPIQYSQKCGM